MTRPVQYQDRPGQARPGQARDRPETDKPVTAVWINLVFIINSGRLSKGPVRSLGSINNKILNWHGRYLTVVVSTVRVKFSILYIIQARPCTGPVGA